MCRNMNQVDLPNVCKRKEGTSMKNNAWATLASFAALTIAILYGQPWL